MTTVGEIEYYIKFVHDVAFPNTLVLWIATCGCTPITTFDKEIQETWELVQERELSVALDKRFLCHQKPTALADEHGCSGPVLNVLAQMVFRMLHNINDEVYF